ncbi:MAG: hypothetical protein AB7S38_04085 [Vulcanimicrobiota bacterium]
MNWLLLVCMAATAWAEPLVLKLTPSEQQVVLGQPITVGYSLINNSNAPVKVGDETRVPRPTLPAEEWGLMFEVKTPAGKTLRLQRLDEFAAFVTLSEEYFQKLSPGQALEGKTTLGNQAVNHTRWALYEPGRSNVTEREMLLLDQLFNRPGVYTVTARFAIKHNQYLSPDGLKSVPGVWQGSVQSKPIKLEVVPRD